MVTFSFGSDTRTICFVIYSQIYSTKASYFQSLVDNRLGSFGSTLNQHLNTYRGKLDSIDRNSSSTDSTLDSIISQFESAIGDQNSGFIGSFVTGISSDVESVYAKIRSEIGTCQPSDSEDKIKAAADSLNSSIQSIVSAAYSSMYSIVSNTRTSFYDHLNTTASDIFSVILSKLSDSYKSSIDNKVSSSVNSLNDILARYKSQLSSLDRSSPTLDNKIQEINNNFSVECSGIIESLNSYVSGELSSLGAKISSVKYPGNNAGDKVTSMYNSINEYYASKSAEFTRSYESVVNAFNIELGSVATNAFGLRRDSLLSTTKSIINNIISSDLNDIRSTKQQLSNGIDRVVDSVRDFLSGSSPSTFIDSSSLRNFKSVTRSDAIDLANSLMSSSISDFGSKSSMIDSSQVNKINTSLSKFNTDLQSLYVPGASTDDLQGYIDELSNFVNSKRDEFTNSVTSMSDELVKKLLDTRQLISKYVDEVLSSYPAIRLTGNNVFPSNISSDGVTPLTFEVINVGGAPWTGWFGIRAVDESGNEYYHNYKPISPVVIPAGATKQVTIEVPFTKYFAGKSPRMLNIRLVSNTYTGQLPVISRGEKYR